MLHPFPYRIASILGVASICAFCLALMAWAEAPVEAPVEEDGFPELPADGTAIIASSNPEDVGPINHEPIRDPNYVIVKVGAHEITLAHVVAAAISDPSYLEEAELGQAFIQYLDDLGTEAALAQIATDVSPLTQAHADNARNYILAGTQFDAVYDSVMASEEQIRAAYDAAYADMDPTREYNASHILLETLEDAITIVSSLASGEEFELLAKEKSIGPSGPGGGNLGWFGPGRMVPEFEEAVEMLKPGEVSGPIETEFGWHIIRLNDSRIPDIPTYEEEKEALKEQIEVDLRTDALVDLISDIPVELMDMTRISASILEDPMKAFEEDDAEITTRAAPSN